MKELQAEGVTEPCYLNPQQRGGEMSRGRAGRGGALGVGGREAELAEISELSSWPCTASRSGPWTALHCTPCLLASSLFNGPLIPLTTVRERKQSCQQKTPPPMPQMREDTIQELVTDTHARTHGQSLGRMAPKCTHESGR